MNIFQLQERLNSAAFAGANLISEDFRLKKAIEQFSEMSSANPVFAKIYQTIKPLAEDTGDKTELLLESLTLVNAVCTAAAVTGKPEQTQKILSTDTIPVQCRCSEVSALQYAIDEKGSGRYEIIKNALDTDSEALLDYRIKPYLYKGLNDRYSEIGTLCGKILIKKYGNTAIRELKESFDVKDSKESLKKLRVIENCGEVENDFYISLVMNESAAIAIREEAVRALFFTEENTNLLIGILNNGKARLRDTALYVLKGFSNQVAKDTVYKYDQEHNVKRGN